MDRHVLHLARQHAALDGRTDGNDLVGVHRLVGSLAEELLHDLLDGGNTRRTAHENHLVDLRSLEARVAQRSLQELQLHTWHQLFGVHLSRHLDVLAPSVSPSR